MREAYSGGRDTRRIPTRIVLGKTIGRDHPVVGAMPRSGFLPDNRFPMKQVTTRGILIENSGRRAREERKRNSEGKIQVPTPEKEAPPTQKGESGGIGGIPPERGKETGGEGEWEPREHLSLAEAVIYRLDREKDFHGISSGSSYWHAIDVGMEIMALQKIKDPSTDPNFDNYKKIADVCITDDYLRQQRIEVTEEMLEQARGKLARELAGAEAILGRNPMIGGTLSMLSKAEKIIERHKHEGVTIEDVLRREDLFAESIRVTYGSLQGYLDKEYVKVDPSKPPKEIADVIPSEILKVQFYEFGHHIARRFAERFWGNEAIAALSQEYRAFLNKGLEHEKAEHHDEIIAVTEGIAVTAESNNARETQGELVTPELKAAALEDLAAFVQKDSSEIESIQTVDDLNRFLGNTARNIHMLVLSSEHTTPEETYERVDGGPQMELSGIKYIFDVMIEKDDISDTKGRVKIVSENGIIDIGVAAYRKTNNGDLEFVEQLEDMMLSFEPITEEEVGEYSSEAEVLRLYATRAQGFVQGFGWVLI